MVERGWGSKKLRHDPNSIFLGGGGGEESAPHRFVLGDPPLALWRDTMRERRRITSHVLIGVLV